MMIKSWILNGAKCSHTWRNFCSSVGVVYKGIKPSEIISASKEQYENCEILRNYIEFKIISHSSSKLRLFIYNKQALKKCLDNKHVLKYLVANGYPIEFDVDNYVERLAKRIKEGNDFPHEIGFFLGYPVKDVLGFMNIIDLPHTKTMGWRMYGNTRFSETYYHKVNDAKSEIRSYVTRVHMSAL